MQTESLPSLEVRLRTVSKSLCRALKTSLDEALGHQGPADSLRPVQLTSQLGLNKSLASRIVRSLRETDELRALQGIPTPQGLQLVERAAAEKGISPEAHAELREATESYRCVLAEFTGGRTDLEATLAGWIPEQRARAERDARRSVFRGMTTLAGVRTGVVYNALYLLPGAEDSHVLDTLAVALRQDVRRLRAQEGITVMSLVADESSPAERQRFGLDGRPIEEDARSLILEELCSHPVPALDLQASGDRLSVCIAKGALDINEMTTLGFGWRTRNHFPSSATDKVGHGSMTFAASKPTECLVLDLFVHKDVTLDGAPFASITSDRTRRSLGQTAPPAEESPERQRAPKVVTLDDPSGLSSQDVRSCKAVAENVCREAGVNPGDFATYRVRIEFPMATEELTLYWALPAAP